jgi:hypothetical protein
MQALSLAKDIDTQEEAEEAGRRFRRTFIGRKKK